MRARCAMKLLPAMILVLMLFQVYLASESKAQEQPGKRAAIIVDHTSTDTSKIPAAWITKAKKNLLVGYTHTSHGSQLVTGIEALKGKKGSLFYFRSTGWSLQPGVFLNDNWAGDHASDLGCCGDLSWRDATVTMLDLPKNDRNVVMWSWCGGVSGSSKKDINTYLQAMNQLEKAYPGVRFIYITGHLDGSGPKGTLNVRNNQIRNYCKKNGKVLFDFADIESYDPDGKINYMKLHADDGCFYDSDGDGSNDANWAQEWIAKHPDSELAQLASKCGGCEHSERLNCILKGRAFWWLMARLAGWSGNP